MKRARSTEEQIIGVLKEHEAGAKTADLACKHGVSEATLEVANLSASAPDDSRAWLRRANSRPLRAHAAQESIPPSHIASSSREKASKIQSGGAGPL